MHSATIVAYLTLFLAFPSLVDGLLCACSHCNGSGTCSVGLPGRCMTRLERDETGKGVVTHACVRADDSAMLKECKHKRTTTLATQCCKKDLCNSNKTPKLLPESPTPSERTRQQGDALVCRCSNCGNSDSCVTKSGGRCLSSVTRRSDGSQTVKLGCVERGPSSFQCFQKSTKERVVTCCVDRDFCNTVHHLPNRTTPPRISTTPSVAKPIVSTKAPVRMITEPFSAVPGKSFSFCHCSGCKSSVCRTDSACVAFRLSEDSPEVTYGCLTPGQSISCEAKPKSNHIFCCRGDFCNEDHKFIDEPVIPTKSACQLVKGTTGAGDLGDSEYVVILVCVTVPSVLILLALTGIFCFTWLKYRKQAEEKRKEAVEKVSRQRASAIGCLCENGAPA